MTPRQLAHFLQNEHQNKSWPKISRELFYGMIPFGTLSTIAKRNGEYIPKKWAALLGVKRAKTSVHRARRLSEMSTAELLSAFNNRVEM
jgi:hypothetical protein